VGHGEKHALPLLLCRTWMLLNVAVALADLLRWAVLGLALEVLRLLATFSLVFLLVAATHV